MHTYSPIGLQSLTRQLSDDVLVTGANERNQTKNTCIHEQVSGSPLKMFAKANFLKIWSTLERKFTGKIEMKNAQKYISMFVGN